ncbi:hypothetical protein TNCV_3462421 [Trichonephila clavipes]|nr:hypothetical protein TNCV_3462421 [Trichonephila clavipes]
MVGDLISPVVKYPSLLGRIVTGDEKWCFLYDPRNSREHRQLETPQSPPPVFESVHEVKKVHRRLND